MAPFRLFKRENQSKKRAKGGPFLQRAKKLMDFQILAMGSVEEKKTDKIYNKKKNPSSVFTKDEIKTKIIENLGQEL